MTTISRLALLSTLALLIPACGGSGAGFAGPSDQLKIDASGGRASLKAGTFSPFGGGGGDILVFSRGHILAGVGLAPTPPAMPAVPTSGFEVTSVAADVTQSGTVLLSGTVTTASAAASYTIRSMGGDVVISGTLIAGDPGAGKPPNLILSAVNGTVYITGAIRTFNTDATPNGEAGGNLTVTAARIVFTGSVDTHGEANPAGTAGNGGAVTLDTIGASGTDILLFGGSIDTSGGSSTSTSAIVFARGGDGGLLSISADAEVQIHGTRLTSKGGDASSGGMLPSGGAAGDLGLLGTAGLTVNGSIVLTGGAATGTGASDGAVGGDGGDVLVNTAVMPTGPVRFFGSMDLRGGSADASLGNIATTSAGDAGTLQIGYGGVNAPAAVDLGGGSWTTAGGSSTGTGGVPGSVSLGNTSGLPGSIDLANAIDASGGFGGGGSSVTGGWLTIDTSRGDILVRGPAILRGGDTTGPGGGSTGKGGSILITAGDGLAGATGSVTVTSMLDVSGGSSLGSAPQDGADAGTVKLEVKNAVGNLLVLGAISANGGAASGSGSVAGGGGTIRLLTRDERIVIAGNLTAKGGTAGTGSSGGGGGNVQTNSDNDNNDVAGSITIEMGVVIDVSGGRGGDGGWARTSAVSLWADGETTPPGDGIGAGVVINNGLIRAAGGDSIDASIGGRGGGILLSGCGPGGPATAPMVGTTSVLGGAGSPVGTTGTVTID